MRTKQKVFYEFGPYRLEPTERRLSKGDQDVSPPKNEFDLLVALVEDHGSLCSYDALIEKVWGTTIVEEGGLNTLVSKLRKRLGDDTKHPRYIETVGGFGYRFIAKATGPSEGNQRARARSLRWGIAGVAFCLAVAVVLFAWNRLTHKTSEDSRLFSLALNYERHGDDEQALTTLDRAIALNSRLAAAYLEAAYIYNQDGEGDKADTYLTKAKSLDDTQDEAFRLKTDALQFDLDGDDEQAIQRYELLYDSFPGDAEADFYFADKALDMTRLEDADRALAACLKVDSRSPYCNMDTLVLKLLRNDFAGVCDGYRKLLEQGIQYPWLHGPVGAALIGENDFDGAVREFKELGTAGKKLHGSIHFRTEKEWLADVAFYRGDLKAGTNQLRESLEKSDSPEERATDLIYLAKIERLFGEERRAKYTAVEATKVSDSEASYTEAAKVLAGVGDAEAVNRVLSVRGGDDTHAKTIGPATRNFLNGALAFRQHKLEEAIGLLSRSNEQDEDASTMFLLGESYEAANHWGDAAQQFQRVLNTRGNVLWNSVTVLVPLAYYHLGNCDLKLGKIQEARANLSQFLVIWQDQSRKEVREANLALASLPR